MEAFGQSCAASWTRVQMVLIWPWSISSERGIVSVARAMFASPARAVSVARSFGWPARRVCFLPPRNLVTSFGRNFSAWQLEVWNGTEVPNELHDEGLAGS